MTLDMPFEQARAAFEYDPESGVIRWKIRAANCVRIGDVAGTVNVQGYVKVKYRGREYAAHRLAWLLTYGRMPSQQIDHIDCDKANNRVANLRDVPQSVNQQNRKTSRVDSESKLLGAHRHMKSWKAGITISGKSHHIGKFTTAREAHEAYKEFKRKNHPGSTL